MTDPAAVQPPEQLRYARVLDWGTWLGLSLLLASFAAYVFGWVDAHVPLQRLPAVWGQPVARYLELTGTPTGWGWLALAHRSDIAGLLGIAALAGCSLMSLLAVLPIYARRGDRAFVAVCVADVAVLLVAAAGWIGGGR